MMRSVKISVIAIVSALALSCVGEHGEFEYKWQSFDMDGHRTGVTSVCGDNVAEALGVVREDGGYVAPDGVVFTDGVTPGVAGAILSVQDKMKYLRRIVGHSAHEMSSKSPESGLSNWIADEYIKAVSRATGEKVDVSFANFGGIRADMPSGSILLDDIVSMFPFKNYLVYISLKGSDLRRIYQQLASDKMQVVGGVRLKVNGSALEEVLINGEPLDDNAVYGVATIDFLMHGGDGLCIADNAIDIIPTNVMVCDAMLSALECFEKEGKVLDYKEDGRVILK